MRSVILGLCGGLFLAGGATAASLCNCCASGTENSCAAVCMPVKPAEGQCVATVDYAGTASIAGDVNPLYDFSLRNVRLGTPKFDELEAFRKLLEAARKGVEKDRKVTLQAFARREVDKATADVAAKRYDAAIVNYYLGLQAYRNAFRDL